MPKDAGYCLYSTLRTLPQRTKTCLLTKIYPSLFFIACNADQGYSLCGDDSCAQSCSSGVPTLDRRRASKEKLGNCPRGQTACYVGDSSQRPRGRVLSYECLDTSTNIESCGGCQYPRDGQIQGQDCTELDGPNEISVSVSAFHEDVWTSH
jgi:hypothetical protein